MSTTPDFWHQLPQPFFALAPMEAVTDVVFRHVVTHAQRPDIFFTEFTSAAGYMHDHGRSSAARRLVHTNDESPLVAQIWGNNPQDFAAMSLALASQGFDGIDINMGCPDKSVVKQGSGSGLIGNYILAHDLILSAKHGGVPVSVKTRLGAVRVDEWHDWLAFLFGQNITNLTIHLRTRKEMSKVPAHYELINDIVHLRDGIAPQTLLTINGDIASKQAGETLIKQHPGVNGIMIGRGIFHNPWAFSELREPTRQQLLELFFLHLDLFDQYNTPDAPRVYDPLKRFFKIYVRGFDGAPELRDHLMHTSNTNEARAVVRGIL